MKIKIETLEELRRHKKISMNDIEKELPRQTYYNVIRKNHKTSDQVWEKLEKVFGISKSELVKLVK
jgi:hypothetical protein